MKAIDLYAYFRALERYFRGNETYEIKAINVDSFKILPDLARWERLAGKREAKNYVLSNVLDNNWTIKQFNDPSYLAWCRVNENMLYNFKEEFAKILELQPTNNLLKLRLDYKISRETLIILCNLSTTNHINMWKNSKDDMEREEGIILHKYSRFVLERIDTDKYRATIKNVAMAAK